MDENTYERHEDLEMISKEQGITSIYRFTMVIVKLSISGRGTFISSVFPWRLLFIKRRVICKEA